MTVSPKSLLTQPVVDTGHADRCACGGIHAPKDHWRFASDMPQDPVALIDDLIKMGLYPPQALSLADTLTQVELKKTLVLSDRLSETDPRQGLRHELLQQAGGIEAALAAAFGPKSSEFFRDTIRSGDFSRRDFLQKVAVSATLIGLSSCAGKKASEQASTKSKQVVAIGLLEETNVRIGFIPITCATPIIMSEPLGFYERYGLSAELVKMPSWAAVRDSAIAGELDAYHMLSPMPIAMTLGLGSTTFPIKLASIENVNGQAITVASKYKDKVKGPADFKGFKIGVPFPFSMHNLLLRYYLAAGGLDPDKDVQISPVPPPDSVARLTVGDIDAMLMPDPFNQRAVFEKVGFIHMLTRDLWPGHPCCAFAASQQWIDANPNTFRAVNNAIIDGARYARDRGNREKIAAAIAPRKYLNQPEEVLRAVLTGKFEDGLGNVQDVPDRIDFIPYPWKSFAYWISSQLVRWKLLPEDKVDYAKIGNQIFLTDLARDLAVEQGEAPPTNDLRVEKLKFDTFDPSNPEAYVKAQIQKYGI